MVIDMKAAGVRGPWRRPLSDGWPFPCESALYCRRSWKLACESVGESRAINKCVDILPARRSSPPCVRDEAGKTERKNSPSMGSISTLCSNTRFPCHHNLEISCYTRRLLLERVLDPIFPLTSDEIDTQIEEEHKVE